LLDALRRLAAANRYTVIVVTHELNLAAEYADQVVLMQRGRCLRVGPPANIYQRELLEQVSRRRSRWTSVPSGGTRHRFIWNAVNRSFFSLTPTLRPCAADHIIANLCSGRRFGDRGLSGSPRKEAVAAARL